MSSLDIERPDPSPALDSLDDFDLAYATYYQSVYRTVRAIVLDPGVAEDVTQESFVKAYRGRDRYRPQGCLESWLHRIATREAISHLRWRQLQLRLFGSVQDAVRVPAADPALGGLLADALAVLNPGTRAAVVLSFYHGYRQREVAGILGVPEGTVASRIANGLKQMRRVMENPTEGFHFRRRST